MPFTIEQSVTIDRPIEEVWEYVVHEDAWRRPFVTRVERLDDGPVKPGSRYEDSFNVAGSEGTVVNEITKVERPTYLEWSQPEGQGGPVRVLEGAYVLEDMSGQTRFTLTNTYEGNGLWKLVMPLMRLQVAKRIYPKMLQQLKEHLASDDSSRNDATGS